MEKRSCIGQLGPRAALSRVGPPAILGSWIDGRDGRTHKAHLLDKDAEMPIYEYRCGGCGAEFEVLVASSKAKPACPTCNSKKLERKFSTFAAHAGGPSTPCESGACPSGAMAGAAGAGGCATGKCPFS